MTGIGCRAYKCLVITALAAVIFLRSLAGFGFPLFAPAMYNALGYGKGDTILAVVAIVVGCPAYVLIINCYSACLSNIGAQSVAILVLWGAITKCEPIRPERQQLRVKFVWFVFGGGG